MTELVVDLAALDAAEADLRATADRLRALTVDLTAGLRPITATWTGAAAEAYAAHQRQWDDAARDLVTVLDELRVRLGAVLVGVGIALTAPTLGAPDVVAGGTGAAAIATAVGELELLAATLLATVGAGLAVAGVVTAGDALVAAIDNAADPRLTQADTTHVGDGPGRGSIDESARAFSPGERRIAEKLAERGHHVRARHEDHSVGGRKADADVDGTRTESRTCPWTGNRTAEPSRTS